VLVRRAGTTVDSEDLEEFRRTRDLRWCNPCCNGDGRRERPDPRTSWKWKAEELRAVCEANDAEVRSLTTRYHPAERNLEKLTGRRVLDRNGLILDIFAQTGRSFEGKLQVELAQLKHISTRLIRGGPPRAAERRYRLRVPVRPAGNGSPADGQRVRVLTRRLEDYSTARDRAADAR